MKIALLTGGPSLERGISLKFGKVCHGSFGRRRTSKLFLFILTKRKELTKYQRASSIPTILRILILNWPKIERPKYQKSLIKFLKSTRYCFSRNAWTFRRRRPNSDHFWKKTKFLLSVLQSSHAKWLLINMKQTTISSRKRVFYLTIRFA